MVLFRSPSLPKVLILLALCTLPNATSEVYNLIYKNCTKQNTTDINFSQDSLSTLFTSLTAHSSTSHFFKTTAGDGHNAASGLFQCQGDLTNADCYNCVSRIPALSTSLCGNAVAGRVQLARCYVRYNVAGFAEVSRREVQYKDCGLVNGDIKEKRKKALAKLENGVVSGRGYFAVEYKGVRAVGQCEGGTGVEECEQCVKAAVKTVEECGDAVSGEVYLLHCYVSYAYYPGHQGDNEDQDGGSGQKLGKTVAAIVGGAFALFIVVCGLLFLRSLWKKDDDY